MASREKIKATFLDELETAVSGLVPSSRVVLETEENDVTLPAVAYTPMSFPVSYNNGSDSKPVEFVYNNSGEKVDEIYRDYRGERIDVRAEATDPQELESIYENVKKHFSRYNQWLESEDFHSDCHDLRVDDASSGSNGDTEPTSRHDRITIRIEYYTDTARYGYQNSTGDPIRQIDSEMDADTDSSTSGTTYTTN